MRLSNYIIKKKIKSLIASNAKGQHTFKMYDQLKNIVVLYEIADFEGVERGISKLKSGGKQIVSYGYVRKEAIPECDESYKFVIEKKDVNIWGVPSGELSDLFKEERADVIIDLTHPGCYALQYLFLNHPCDFKAGIKKHAYDFYDVSIVVTDKDEISYLFEQILFYLQNIRTK